MKNLLRPPRPPAFVAATLNLAVKRIQERRWTVAAAESLTGGLLAHLLTSIPGGSAYFDRGVTAYSNRAKVELLGVPELVIATHGAVSEECALAMAQGLRSRSGVELVLAVTGIAGPGGARPGKPVGLVWAAVSAPDGEKAVSRIFRGSRQSITWQAAVMALELVPNQPLD